jgi:hypothetical protein
MLLRNNVAVWLAVILPRCVGVEGVGSVAAHSQLAVAGDGTGEEGTIVTPTTPMPLH